MTAKPGQFVETDRDFNCINCGRSCLDMNAQLSAEAPAIEDKIRHPKHYIQGIECWDYITSHKMGYLEGNIIKYITRYKHKDGLNDLDKAKAYLDRLIEEVSAP